MIDHAQRYAEMYAEMSRFRTELELDLNRFLLVKALIERGDLKGAIQSAGVAVTRLRSILYPPVPAPPVDVPGEGPTS